MPRIIPFEPGHDYYIRTQTAGNAIAFVNRDAYSLFTYNYTKYMPPVSKTFAYVLLPNQFHFIFRVTETAGQNNTTGSTGPATAMGNILSSFTQIFNRTNNRNGQLFVTPLKRSLIADEYQFINLIRYIHRLPVDYGLVNKPETWRFSSYPYIINKQASFVHDHQLTSLFFSLKEFETFHSFPSGMNKEFTFPLKLKAATERKAA